MEIEINQKEFDKYLDMLAWYAKEYLGSNIPEMKEVGRKFDKIYSFMDRINLALIEGYDIHFKLNIEEA